MSHHPTAAALARPVRDLPSAMRTAARLLSETAHDIRSPLTAIRETVRMVNDGYLGPITDEQRIGLLDAIERCDEISLMVADMLQWERLRSGMPRVHRRWIDPLEVCRAVAATLSTHAQQCEVTLLWDTPSPGPQIYADADKLRRLLINIVGNAIRVTPAGGQVLVRTADVASRGACRFTVLDRGPGMDLSAVKRSAQRGTATRGGEGLGLAISRQMASLHFGLLQATNAADGGARFDFEIPAAGPLSVADAWLRWREGLLRQPPAAIGRQRLRLDRGGSTPIPAARSLAGDGKRPITVSLIHDGPPPRHPDRVTATSVRLDAAVPAEAAHRLDATLQDGLRMYELAYRADTRRWVLLWDVDVPQAKQRIAALQSLVTASNPAARMVWSRQLLLEIGTRSARARIRDALVRDSLGNPGTWMPAAADCDLRDPRTLPAVSDVASRRLDEELRRLTRRLDRQRSLLQDQAAALRAPQP